ncbi:hypothetical protein ACFSC6_06290 [Rufibacter sediminis]|uniref:Barstar (barnase inhibitor) domain-containing protein n=1 Tax=Rufibacter sediminis TaxID=2762756 RepID=A0ABR6VP06_9BACT|nr:hypothetical protein [Rufibacter sediminis]MBC3538614.1 hypothetical protein [Rufibacter sediminis]
MGVARSIRIRVVTNYQTLSSFIQDFTNDFWTLKNPDGKFYSIAVDDNDDFNHLPFDNFEEVSRILDKREELKRVNSLVLWDIDYFESNSFLVYPLDNNYEGYSKHYELSFVLGIGKRISGSDRYTDYSHYLNLMLPKLKQIGSYVCEVECQDFDS